MPEVQSPQELADAPAFAVERFGKYHLVRKLAEGGMAEIFLAKHVGPEGFERDVVIKRMLSELSANGEFVAMFLDEARLAARLLHHNIVAIHDLGQEDGHYYICMEYLPGEDFSTILRAAARKREFVPLGIVGRIVADAAAGLHFAHEYTDAAGRPMQVVHRDVSPSNIFASYQGHVKMLDFGIAKAESRVSVTTAGKVKGKYIYMAPEQAKGNPIDRRVDVFALGLNLYEALTRVRPFARDTTLAILEALNKGEVKPPRKIRPSIPEPLEQVVMKALAADPVARYQTARELAEELLKALGPAVVAGDGLAQYLEQLFGTERVQTKTRIPPLSQILREGGDALMDLPGTDYGRRTPSSVRTPPSDEGSPVHPTEQRTINSPPPVPEGARTRRVLLIGGLSAGLVLLGAASALVLRSGEPPAPPASSARAPAVLVISSDPPGARITVDGKESGTSPVKLTGLPAGEHRVAAELDGRSPVERTVRVGGPGERTNLDLSLPELASLLPAPLGTAPKAAEAERVKRPAAAAPKGKLSLDTDPWTQVYLGKRKLGETPLVNVALPAGTHVLKLVNEAKGISSEVEIEIRAGKTTAKKLRF